MAPRRASDLGAHTGAGSGVGPGDVGGCGRRPQGSPPRALGGRQGGEEVPGVRGEASFIRRGEAAGAGSRSGGCEQGGRVVETAQPALLRLLRPSPGCSPLPARVPWRWRGSRQQGELESGGVSRSRCARRARARLPRAALPPHAIPGGARGSGREALPGAGPAQRRGSRSRSGQQLREGTCRGDGQRVRRRLPPACRGSRRGAGACRPLGAARRVLSRWGGRRGPGLGRSGPRCPRAGWAGSGCGPGPARPAGGLRGSLGPCTTPAIP